MKTKWSCLLLLPVIFVCCCAVCEDGKFGWKCKFKCYCANRTEACDKVTGDCSTGCRSNRYGPGCQLLTAFKYDQRGQGYMGKMSFTTSNKPCQSWDIYEKLYNLKPEEFPDKVIPEDVCRNPENKNVDHFPEASKGPWCFTNITFLKRESCDIALRDCGEGRFGKDCAFECHCEDVQEACNTKIGTCKSGCHPGWIGSSCQEKCKEGIYGKGCAFTCGHCKTGPCYFETGKCEDGCEAGWKGEKCDTACAEGEYGENCENTCGFCLNGTCDVVTGVCPGECQDGYLGERCKQPCTRGFFGRQCKEICGNCMNSECRHTDGICTDGCLPGWTLGNCTLPCQSYTYGENCSYSCGKCKDSVPCHHETGECENGCHTQYTGPQCIVALQEEEKVGNASGTIGAVIGTLVLVIIIVIILLVIYRYRRRYKGKLNVREKEEEHRRKEVVNTKETDKLLPGEAAVVVDNLDDTDPNDNLNEPIYANVNSKKQSEPIKVEDLYEYIRTNKKNECEGFKKEFGELPIGLTALCEAAKKAENRPKNRYGNITAYDHSRVVLEPLPNEPSSDYINANYMDGYNTEKAYIASQGPTKVMIRDFWRMVWQKRVCKIVMLTNLMEACKKKCEQYWPDEGIQKYGDITVEILDTALFTDYTIRTFRIASSGSSRIVKQFHFTSWSDHGALTYPTPLLAFKRKVKMYSPDSKAPIIVHCSAGIGRSGTYIALDYLLEQAKSEDIVDVLKCAHLMRANRINMIQTWEQYVFVYEALLEAIKAGETTIPNSIFRAQYEELCTKKDDNPKSPLEEQFEVLQLITPTIENSQYKAAIDPENVSKNRVKNVLPANRCRPYLYTQVEGCNDYINAVFLPGYTHRDSFIVTQMPLPNTVADFWRMLYDYNSHTVIMLNEFDRNDKTCALYWPEEYGYTVEYDPLSIELLSSTEDNNVSVRIFKLCNHIKKDERAIKQFQLNSWPDYRKVPNTTNSLMQLIEMVFDWLKQNGKGPLTVHCMNGASKSGLFCAVNLLFERMQRDMEVDVYQTVKTIRINRPQFIEDVEQYQFIYQMALEYLDYTGR